MATCSFSKQFFATGIIFIENYFEMFAELKGHFFLFLGARELVPLIFAAKECRSQSGFKKIEVSPKKLAAFCRNGEREGREKVRRE